MPRGSGGLARRAREQFVTHVEAALEPLGLAIKARLTELVDNSALSLIHI